MGIFGSIIKLGMDVITTPIAVIKDVATLGGALTEEPSAVGKKFDQISEDWDDIKDELDD